MATYNDNRSPNLVIPSQNISSLNNNRGVVKVGGGSHVLNCFNNRGSIRFQPHTEISNLSDNNGIIVIQHSGIIGKISNNQGAIKIDPNTKIHSIEFNKGTINFGENCTVDSFKNNFGIISGLRTINTIARNITTVTFPPSTSGASRGGNANARNGARGSRNMSLVNNQPSRPNTAVGSGANRNGITNGASPVTADSSSSSSSSNNSSTSGPPFLSLNNAFLSTPVTGQNNSENGDDINKFQCVICMQKSIEVTFGCGHCCCSRCAEQLRNCHQCGQKIFRKIKLYL